MMHQLMWEYKETPRVPIVSFSPLSIQLAYSKTHDEARLWSVWHRKRQGWGKADESDTGLMEEAHCDNLEGCQQLALKVAGVHSAHS